MNAQKTLEQIMRERRITRQLMAEKMGYSTPSTVTMKLRTPNGIRSDILVEMLNQMDCELVVRSKTKDKREWVITASNDEEE